jgi:hypothetical protein
MTSKKEIESKIEKAQADFERLLIGLAKGIERERLQKAYDKLVELRVLQASIVKKS